MDIDNFENSALLVLKPFAIAEHLHKKCFIKSKPNITSHERL